METTIIDLRGLGFRVEVLLRVKSFSVGLGLGFRAYGLGLVLDLRTLTDMLRPLLLGSIST